jgi:hypothetical protein
MSISLSVLLYALLCPLSPHIIYIAVALSWALPSDIVYIVAAYRAHRCA